MGMNQTIFTRRLNMESFSFVDGVRPARTRQGFTLVVTLTILAAVTILVVGLFGIVGRERQVSGTYDSVDQADLAVQAGLEDASSLLKQALADELGVIFAAPLTPEVDAQGRRREMLVAGRYDVTSQAWQYQALASGTAAPPSSERLVEQRDRPPKSGYHQSKEKSTRRYCGSAN